MMKLTSVTYQNFKSVGNAHITVRLDNTKTTLLSGTNGAGKSTLLDAICFALYGKGYGSVNKPQLINSVNQKQCLVTIDFEIGRKKFTVRRGMKPNIFEIIENGKLRKKSAEVKDDQKVLEQQILKMNYRAFTQVVIMGSGYYVPFMRLPAAQRREFVEDLLDIRVFSIMNRLLFDKNKTLKEELRDTDVRIKSAKEKFKMQETFIEKMKKERHDDVDRHQKEITRLEKENISHSTKIDRHQNAIQKLSEKLAEFAHLDEEIGDVRSHTKRLEKSIRDHQTKRSFYHTTDQCPTCSQPIHENHKSSLVESVDSDIKQQEKELVSLEKKMDGFTKAMVRKNKILEQVSEENEMVDRLNRLVIVNNALIKNANYLIGDQQNNTSSIDAESTKLKEFAKEIVSSDNTKRSLLDNQQYYDLAAIMLQDNGIKSRIIKQYIPTINKLINKYLGALDFFVSFNLDENFNETVKSRYRDEFTYESFSEGQKTRIDLALTFAFREIAKMKNSVNTNLLIFDEILDSSMDTVGVDLFMSLLDKVNIDNVFIISHRDIGDKFEDHIRFELQNNFTVRKER